MSTYSPHPGVPQTPTKAFVGAMIAFLITFGAYYVGDTDPFTKKEMVQAFILGAIGSGLTGTGTYATKNKPKVT